MEEVNAEVMERAREPKLGTGPTCVTDLLQSPDETYLMRTCFLWISKDTSF